MSAAVSQRLRREARALRAAAKRTWFLSEELLEQATALDAEAQRLEDAANEQDDLSRLETLSGGQIRVRKERRAAYAGEGLHAGNP